MSNIVGVENEARNFSAYSSRYLHINSYFLCRKVNYVQIYMQKKSVSAYFFVIYVQKKSIMCRF